MTDKDMFERVLYALSSLCKEKILLLVFEKICNYSFLNVINGKFLMINMCGDIHEFHYKNNEILLGIPLCDHKHRVKISLRTILFMDFIGSMVSLDREIKEYMAEENKYSITLKMPTLDYWLSLEIREKEEKENILYSR